MHTIFISYSHKDKDWVQNWLLPKLETNGLPCHIDFRDFEIGVPGIINMERAVETCDKTVLVLTPDYLNSDFAQFEAILLQSQDPTGLKKRIVPLMLKDCQLPKRLAMLTWADFRDPDRREAELQRVIRQIKADFRKLDRKPAKPTWPELAPEHIDIDRLPQTGYELFGRQQEIMLLDNAWESDSTHVVSFVAYGGMGKSTLVNKWLERLRWDNYRGAQKVFGWSFYSQGTNEQVTSADAFIGEALRWFGDPDPDEGSPWDKGKRLARLIQRHKTLLVLDGLEPLQSGFEFEAGKIKDPALGMLITELAKDNPGLCVISTRVALPELARYPQCCVQQSLETLSPEAGAALLRLHGVRGSDAELQQASRDFGNHALAITLLGAYLHELSGHPVAAARDIPDLDIPVEKGRHPRRVMQAIAEKLGPGPKLELLHVLGLFNRPAERAAINSVTAAPVIPGLTDSLHGMDEAAFLRTCDTLRRYRLLARESRHRPDTLDCHPLVREHFGERLRQQNPEAWRAAHARLYDYYKGLPEKLYGKHLPDTLQEMEPLFAAVAHGCLAGKHQEALEEVYKPRIRRTDEAFAIRKLGAYGSELAALANFFDKPWKNPVAELSEGAKTAILSWAGFRLRALGRLQDAITPMVVCLERYKTIGDLIEIAKAYGNLSETYLFLGEMKMAVECARESVKYVDNSNNSLYKVLCRTILATALHTAGDYTDAEKLFYEAESIQRRNKNSKSRILYAMPGFRFSELLLDKGEYKNVINRAEKSLKIISDKNDPLIIAFDNLSLGRAYFLKTAVQGADDHFKAEYHLNLAVKGLREAGTEHHIPRGLLARAALLREQQNFHAAWDDLTEAQEIAGRGEMQLHRVDYHLEAARVCVAERRADQAQQHAETAAALVAETGYHRRDGEVALCRAQVARLRGERTAAHKHLQEAKATFDRQGIRMWDWEVAALEETLHS